MSSYNLSGYLKHFHGLPIIHTDSYVCGLPPAHRFQMGKFRGVLRSLVKDGVVVPSRQVLEPSLQRGLACSTAGGTHHAGPDYGSGYCLLNDLAITAASLLSLKLVQKVLIVDLDVHQGDGTALIFRDNPQVFTFSLHCQSNFPWRKQPSDLDIGLADHVADREYHHTLRETLPSLMEQVRPDIVIYDAGVDPHVEDDLGKLNLTDEGLYERDLTVLDCCVSRGVPVCSVIGGGYHRDLEILSRRHSIVHRAATEVFNKRLLL